MDSEGLLQCPYDKNHMIRPSRFPYHLVKCRENNQHVAKALATCPFNARHRVPKKELELHMQSCESKCPLEPLPEECSAAAPAFVLNEFGGSQPYNTHETGHEQSPPSWSDDGNWVTVESRGHHSHSHASGSGTASKRGSANLEDEWPRLGKQQKTKQRNK